MARIPSGVLGALIGKAGPVSGYMRNGDNIIRTAAKRRDPKITPLRSAQRQKIKVSNDFTHSFSGTGFLNRTFPAYGTKGNGYNRATSVILNLAITGTYPDTCISWPEVLISKGPLPGARNPASTFNAGGDILFRWDDNSEFGTAKEDDKVVLVAYFPESKKAFFEIGNAVRKDGSAILPIKNAPGDFAETWIGFLSNDEKDAGDSVYAGLLRVEG